MPGEQAPKPRSRSFYPARRRFAVNAALGGVMTGCGYGFSPLIAPLSLAFPNANPYAQGAGAFMFSEALLLFGCYISFILYELGRRSTQLVKQQMLIGTACAGFVAAPLSFLFMGAAVAAKQQWMLYVFAAPIYGVIISSAMLFSYVIVDWFTPDGRKGRLLLGLDPDSPLRSAACPLSYALFRTVPPFQASALPFTRVRPASPPRCSPWCTAE